MVHVGSCTADRIFLEKIAGNIAYHDEQHEAFSHMNLKLTLFLSTYLVSCRSIPTSEPSHKLNDHTLAAEAYRWIKAATTVTADRGS
jgi:hypothetical protein